MTEITANYRNKPIIPMPILEDNLDVIQQEGSSDGSSTPPSIGSSNRSRGEYNSTHIGKLTFPRQIVEEKAHKKCIEIFTNKLAESLFPTAGSYSYLSDMYKADRLARQMFYEIAQKSGADKLYLSTKLDNRYQIEDNFVVTIEQESKRFFLDTPFGRRQIKNPEDRSCILRSSILNKCCQSKTDTLRAILLITVEIGRRIFFPRRAVKSDPFIRLEDYMNKKWRRVQMDPLNEVDEGLGVHYSPTRELAGYRDPALFTSFQVYDIEKRLRSRKQL